MMNPSSAEGKWTERSTANAAALDESVAMFRLLFERSADAMTLQDPLTGSFVDANAASVRMTGAPNQAALLDSNPVLISPERQPDGALSAEKVKEVLRVAVERGSHRFEWVINRFDGTQLPVEIVLTLIRSGERPLLLSVSRDITERLRTEAELRAHQQLLVSVTDNLSEAIYRTGPNHELIFTNNAYLRLAGYASFEELRDCPREQLYAHPADRQRLLDLLTRHGAFHNEEIQYRRRDGAPWWGLTNSVAIHDEATGRVLYHVGSVADITERKRAADEVRELNATLERRIAERTAALTASEARLRTILEHAPEAIVVFDGDTGKFLNANRHALELYGCTPEELQTLTPAEVSPEFQPDGRRSAEAARDWMSQAITGKVPSFEWVHQHRSGRLVPTEVRLVRLPHEGRTLLRASITDNTEHKRTEEKLRRRGEQIQKHRDVLLKLARLDKSDFDRALAAITSCAASTLEVARVSYWSLAAQDAALVCELLHLGPEDRAVPEFKGTRLGAQDAPAYFSALALKRPIAANDVSVHPATEGLLASYLRPLNITSMLDVPVWVRGEVIGVICHEHTGPQREWSPEEVDFASSLAAMVSLAVEESQRARSERLLRESEEKFKALFALSPLGMARVSWDGRFLQVNDSFARIIGRLPAEVLQLSYWDVTPREYEAQELMVLDTIRRTGRFGPFEKEYLHRDGHRVPIVISGMLVKNAAGDNEIWGIVQDITQRRQSERALRESEEKFRALFMASSQGVMLHDERQYLEVNPAIVRMLGYDSAEELIGLHPGVTSPPVQPNGGDSMTEAQKHIDACLTHGHVRFDWVARRKTGENIPVEVFLTRIQWGGKQIIQAAVNDISQRKQAEAELRKALAHEKELGELKSSFVSMVSHEFRTPLGIIQSSAEILDDYLDRLEPAERREQLQSIIKNTRRMAGLMEDVLLVGRLDAGRMHFHPAPLDLAALCRQLVDEARATTDAPCPIEFFTSSLPAEARVDERLLRHILLNLLTNALKYSEPGQRVSFHAQGHGGNLEFIVADRGIGIPEAQQERLFEAFQRGSNVGNRHGSGLGLLIVKRCVDLHGGEIHVSSKPGEGTTVRVIIPSSPAA